MLILLPDFIGHPSCFRGLLARLGATDCRPVDYHRLDAYASIEALASQVLDGLAEEPDWLIGYSFGGLVGYEMARQLPASRLLMIDSHLPWPALRRMPPSEQYQRWLSAEMREWIALMSELGELREEVLLRNVELFGRWHDGRETRSAEELEWAATELRNALRSIEWDLEDLDDTVGIVEKNPAKLDTMPSWSSEMASIRYGAQFSCVRGVLSRTVTVRSPCRSRPSSFSRILATECQLPPTSISIANSEPSAIIRLIPSRAISQPLIREGANMPSR